MPDPVRDEAGRPCRELKCDEAEGCSWEPVILHERVVPAPSVSQQDPTHRCVSCSWTGDFEGLKQHVADHLRAEQGVSQQGTGERDFGEDEIEFDGVPYVLRPGPVMTNSAVRVRHKSTGVTVICDENKSQLANKDEALRRLRLILASASPQQEGRRA